MCPEPWCTAELGDISIRFKLAAQCLLEGYCCNVTIFASSTDLAEIRGSLGRPHNLYLTKGSPLKGTLCE